MPRRHRLVVWLLVLAFIVPLPLGGALAASECLHEQAGDDGAMDGSHAHHAMTGQSVADAHPCCPDDAAMPQADVCDGDSCGGCAMACSVVASLPAAGLGIDFDASASLAIEPAQTNHTIYPQVPHQPPRV